MTMICRQDYIAMAAAYGTPKPHCHYSMHMILGMDGPVESEVNGNEISGYGICIDSNVEHTAAVRRGKTLVILVETNSRLGRRLKKTFLTESVHGYGRLPESLTEAILESWESNCPEKFDQCLYTLNGTCQLPQVDLDERIEQVLQMLREQEEIPSGIISELCGKVCLSQSRLSHLFREQMGISLSSYLLWMKMEKAFQAVLAGKNLTCASMEAGFATPSHMAAAFRRMFGITFSEYLASI